VVPLYRQVTAFTLQKALVQLPFLTIMMKHQFDGGAADESPQGRKSSPTWSEALKKMRPDLPAASVLYLPHLARK